MASPTEISVPQLARLIGLPEAPMIIDVRIDDDFNTDPFLVPGARRFFRYQDVAVWGPSLRAKPIIAVCREGRKLSQGVAAWLRNDGVDAQSLEGGTEAWRASREIAVRAEKIPRLDTQGRSVWVTRARPKIDRIACPWLIRRFIDPSAVFLFVSPPEVSFVADRFGATPFDIDDVFWSHRGDRCTFDIMLDEFGLETKPLRQLALIVRGADTARLDLAPQAAGLLAVSLGYSRMFKDDLVQLDAAMSLYDALYRWCRDATDEGHNWPTSTKPAM